jgi:transposase
MSRKKYTEDYKIAAVKLYQEGKQTAAEIAKDLGIAESLLYAWIKKYGTKDSKSNPFQEENKRLKAELAEVRKKLALAEEHREILKKAAAYFAVQTL